MITIDNYIKIVDREILNRLPLDIQNNHGNMVELIQLIEETPELIEDEKINTEVMEHLKFVNSVVYSEKKQVDLEVTKQDGSSYRIEEIKPVEKLVRTIEPINEPINEQLDVPFNNTISVHLQSTVKYSLLEQLIIEQRVKNTVNLTNAKIRKMTGCTRFAFNNALVYLQAKNIIPTNWVTQNKAGRPIK